MNWYKFRIELSAWLTKTALAVISTFVFLQLFTNGASTHEYPLSLRWVAEHEPLIVAILLSATGFTWFCYWKAFRILRGNRRYVERF